MAATWKPIPVGKKPDVLITFAGWSLRLEGSAAWATALAQAMPADPSYAAGGVGEAFAVMGPPASGPSKPIDIHAFAGIADLVGAVRPHLDGGQKRIYVLAHSSGTAYADHFYKALYAKLTSDKSAPVPQQIWHYNIDGGPMVQGCDAMFARAFAVSATIKTKTKPVPSQNYPGNKLLGDHFSKTKPKPLGKFLDVDLTGKVAANLPHDPWLLHMALINFKDPLWAVWKHQGPLDPKFYAKDNDINPTYNKCTKDNVTVDYFSQSFSFK
jgi:hypothetical protein